jgi:hypothetical protein
MELKVKEGHFFTKFLRKEKVKAYETSTPILNSGPPALKL